jgi:hypothetical protein
MLRPIQRLIRVGDHPFLMRHGHLIGQPAAQRHA